MAELFVDDVSTTLASSATSGATSVSIVSAAGLPTMGAGDVMRVRFEPATPNGTFELALVTARSGTTLTVARGQEGTAPHAWAAGDTVSFVVTVTSLSFLPTTTQTLPATSITGVAATVLHDCEAVSSSFGTWSANNLFSGSVTLSTTRITTGTHSVQATIYVSQLNNPNMTSQFWCDLAADVSVTAADTLALDVGYESSGTATLFWDQWGTTEFWVADGVGLTGNIVKTRLPADTTTSGTSAPLSTITFGFGGLAKVRSFGFVIVANSPDGTTDRLKFVVDNVRLKEKSDVEVALSSASLGGAIVASETGGLANFAPRTRTGKAAWDQRSPGGFWASQFGRHIREFIPNIDTTGAADVTDELNAIIRQLERGDRLYCDPDSVFRVDGIVDVIDLDRVVLDWHNSRFYTTVDHTDTGAMFNMGRGFDVQMRNFRCYGYIPTTTNGSAMELSAGTPTVSGTTYTLPTLGDSVRNAHNPSSGKMRYFARSSTDKYPIDITLSASVAAANDCLITLVDENGLEQYREVLTLTTSPTVYHLEFAPLDLTTRVEWRVTKNTSATSTITVSSLTLYGQVGYDGTRALFAGVKTSSGVNGLILEDFLAEGFGGDGFQCSSQAERMTLRRFMSRANRRQGVSVNGNRDGAVRTRVNDFTIIGPARHGIDLEPETSGANVDDIRFSDGSIYAAGLGGFVAQGWSRITDMHVHDITEYPGDFAGSNFDGGAVGGTVSRYFVDSTAAEDSGQTSQINPKFIVRGQNMMVSDIVCDHGFEFSNATSTNDTATLSPSGNYATGIRVRRAGNHATALVRAPKSRIDNVTTIGPDEGFAPGKGGSVGLAVGPVELNPGGSFSDLDLNIARNQFPDTFRGTAHSSLWVPLGMNVGAEPILGVRGISSRGAAITVKSSATVTTTTSGSAVTVTPYSTLRLMLDITAASGTSPTLDVTLEASHDLTTWRPVGSFTQHTVACRETIDFLVGAEPNVRVTATVAGTSPSFTYSVTGRQHVPATHLAGNLAVTTSATTGTVVFPTSTVPVNPGSFALAQGGTSGTLTALGTYYYRVAGRMRPGGPVVPLTEKNITLTGSNTAVNVTTTFSLTTPSVAPEGLTIYRGTSAGTYNTRFDWLPNARMWGTRGAQLLVDQGETLLWAVENELTSGYPTTTCRLAGSVTPVDETGWEVDALYKVQITPSWATTVGVTTKRRDGFDLTFGTAAPSGASVDWFLVR